MTSIYERHDTILRIKKGSRRGGAYEENSDAEVKSRRGLPQGLVRELEGLSLITGTATDVDGETHNRDDERNPHEEVEASKDIVERLQPVLGRRGANNVSAIF
jgi:hypothetical protein